MSTASASEAASGSPTAIEWMTTPFCAAMAAAFCGAMRLPVSVPSESRIRTRDSTSEASNERMASPIASPSMVFWPAMPGASVSSSVRAACGVAGEGHQHVGRVAEDDEPDAVVAAVGDEAVEHRLDAVEPRAARAVGAGEVAGRHRARDVDGEHDVAGGLGALDRIADPFRAGEREDDERPGEPGEGHLPAGTRQDHGAFALVEPGGGGLEERQPHRLHHLAPGRGEPEHQERKRQREERQGGGQVKHDGGRSSAAPPPARRRRRTAAAWRRARPRAPDRRRRSRRRCGRGTRARRRRRASRPRRGDRPTSAVRRSRVSVAASARGSPARERRGEPGELGERRAAVGGGAAVAHDGDDRQRDERERQGGDDGPGPGGGQHRDRRRLGDVVEPVDEVDEAVGRRFHQAMRRRGGAPKSRRSCGTVGSPALTGRIAASSFACQSSSRLSRSPPAGREVAADAGVGEVELDLQDAVADHDPAGLGDLVGRGVVDQRHDHVVAAADPGEVAQRGLAGAVEVGDDEDEPVVGDDPGGAGEGGVEPGRGIGHHRRLGGKRGVRLRDAARAGAGRRRGCGGPGRRRSRRRRGRGPPTRSPGARMRQAASAAISAAVTDFMLSRVP